MRRIEVTAAAVLTAWMATLFPAAAAEERPGRWRIKSHPCADLLERPESSADVLRCLPANEVLIELERVGEWLRLEGAGITGWMSEAFVTPLELGPSSLETVPGEPSGAVDDGSHARRLRAELEIAREELDTFQALALESENELRSQVAQAASQLEQSRQRGLEARASQDALATGVGELTLQIEAMRDRLEGAERRIGSLQSTATEAAAESVVTMDRRTDRSRHQDGALEGLELQVEALGVSLQTLTAGQESLIRHLQSLEDQQAEITSQLSRLGEAGGSLADITARLDRLEKSRGIFEHSGVLDRINAWADAWSSRDPEAYLSFYSEQFQPERGSRAGWEALRRQRLQEAQFIELQLSDLSAVSAGTGQLAVEFLQFYRSNLYEDAVRKRLLLSQEEDGWRITSESVLDTVAEH